MYNKNSSSHVFIPEDEAASSAGVSVNTLLRFAEAGYLSIDTTPEGSRRYAKEDIRSIFGFSDGSLAIDSEVEDEVPETVVGAPVQGGSVVQFPGKSSNEASTIEEGSSHAQRTSTVSEVVEAVEEPNSHREVSSSPDSLEFNRMQNIIDIQEKILDIRDQELAELRKERDWLRERVERLEQKAERDQLLLLAETQTLRQLITHEKRSPVRATLEWLGFVEPQKEPVKSGSSIDHK